MTLYHPGVTTVSIASVTDSSATSDCDELSVEEPLEIVVEFPGSGQSNRTSIAVTMRTPGNDTELAVGFLLTEGLIRDRSDLVRMEPIADNVICVTIAAGADINFKQLERHSFVSSSCGICGKRSIAAVFGLLRHELRAGCPQIRCETIHGMSQTQRRSQPTFARTGGLHAAALFNQEGQILALYEDVGRHNAVDKLVGSAFLAGRIPLQNDILFLSGRASFELIQKAAIAGIPIVAAVGAPSSLAVTLARNCSMTLLGFVRDGRFNVYADSNRLVEPAVKLEAGFR
jgi:FdhD protein